MKRNAKDTPLFLALVALLPFAGFSAAPEPAPVQVQMRGLTFHLERNIVLDIRHLRGEMDRTDPNRPVTFDDPKSFQLKVDSAEIAIGASSLAALLNTYVFAYEGAPLKNISVTIENGRVKQKGTMHKGVDLPFEMEGTVSATSDGNIRLHAEKIKSAHVSVKGLLHLFGEDLAKLVNVSEAHGVRIEGNDIILFPSRMAPPPHLLGKVVKAYVQGNRIVQIYDSGEKTAALKVPRPSAGYIYHRGGELRFGKLTMEDADLEITSTNPKGAFDFSLQDYSRQLVAGYSKTTASQGLIAYMPNFWQLSHRTAAQGRP